MDEVDLVDDSDLPGLMTLQEQLAMGDGSQFHDIHNSFDFPVVTGIEATDVGSLLQQFEEASDNLGECDGLQPSINVNVELERKKVKMTSSSYTDVNKSKGSQSDSPTTENSNKSKKVAQAKELAEKFRAMKRKSTIMLPLGMPSKKGRGCAVVMPADCASPKLQRMVNKGIVQLPKPLTDVSCVSNQPAASTKGSVEETNVLKNKNRNLSKKEKKFIVDSKKDIVPVSASYYSEISDHDYCTNVPRVTSVNLNVGGEGNQTNQLLVTKSCQRKDYTKEETLTDSKSLISPSLLKLVKKTDSFTAKPSVETCNNSVNKCKPVDLHNKHEEELKDSKKKDIEQPCSQEDSLVEEIDILEEITEAEINDLCQFQNSNSTSTKKYDEIGKGIKTGHSKGKRNYRKQQHINPDAEDENGKFFDKIPAYYTTLSIRKKANASGGSVSKLAGKTKISIQDYFERNPSPTRDPSVFNKLPAYYSCFTNSTKFDEAVDQSEKPSSSQESVTQCSSGYSSRSDTPALVIDSRVGSRNVSRSPSNSPSTRGRSNSRESSRRSRRESWTSEKRRRSSYSSADSCSSSSQSRSRSRSRSRSKCSRQSYSRSPVCQRRKRSRSDSESSYCSRSPTPERRRKIQKVMHEENKHRQNEERRIIYVGRIPDGYTRHQMKKRFECFGEIESVQLHFRESADNYGFVTFAYTCDAYAAVSKGNLHAEPKFDLCFGGRRQFCETAYEDLDGENELIEEFNPISKSKELCDFDQLLAQAKKKIKK